MKEEEGTLAQFALVSASRSDLGHANAVAAVAVGWAGTDRLECPVGGCRSIDRSAVESNVIKASLWGAWKGCCIREHLSLSMSTMKPKPNPILLLVVSANAHFFAASVVLMPAVGLLHQCLVN